MFGKTLRQDPAEAETASHRLFLKAGFIHQIASGVYAYLPIALRTIHKIEQIIREEMEAAGAQELKMPSLQPLELWDQTNRATAFGPNLMRLKDRRDREMVIAPTHEEVVTLLARLSVQSYRDLPMNVFQIQTKFRDEPRPRAGLIRVREFDMKDAYSFDADEEALDLTYRRMLTAYQNIYRRCGLPFMTVEADSGAIGGKDSHEFILPTESGEDLILFCTNGDYAANVERAASRRGEVPKEEPLALEEVHTLGVRTIQELADFLSVPAQKTLKAVFYVSGGEMVFVTLRGDLEVNEVKLNNLLHGENLHIATDEEVKRAGLVAGSASPVGLKGVKIVADTSINEGGNFVAGANREDYHLRNANPGRDFEPDLVADIAQAAAGQGCPTCDGILDSTKGIEVGHIFKLGTFFSETLGAHFLDQEGQQKPLIMGCYGIGVGRLMAAAIEQSHDDAGMIWAAPIAPYQVHLVALNADNPEVALQAEALYKDMRDAGLEVLFDDRPETAGVKFNDADLLGLPIRVVISPRTIKASEVELKLRSGGEAIKVPQGEALEQVKALLAD
ncbi:MAG: prolyl-tRNA synthetase [Chloroflexi bacterium]|jgi:prolyl-tRNA synthetase|nr:MAG: prolyl-tRNA synthetase [Chloroflexota bacterium]